FIANDRGYFDDLGLAVTFERFDNASVMLPALATNKLDVGSGAVSVSLYNALQQDVGVKIVGSKSIVLAPNFGGGAVMVRQDLWPSDAIRGPADLRGLKVALNSIGTSSSSYVIRPLEAVGLTKDDVEFVQLPFPEMIPAYRNHAIDAAF